MKYLYDYVMCISIIRYVFVSRKRLEILQNFGRDTS
jgi:hypothetical protein